MISNFIFTIDIKVDIHNINKDTVLVKFILQSFLKLCISGKNDQVYFFNLMYLFMRDTERERGRDTGRGRSRFPARSPCGTRSQIPGSGLEPKVDTLNHRAIQVSSQCSLK